MFYLPSSGVGMADSGVASKGGEEGVSHPHVDVSHVYEEEKGDSRPSLLALKYLLGPRLICDHLQ